jgi:SAM-dependent methyltransferase
MTNTNTTGSAAKHAAVWGPRANDWAALQEDKVQPLYDAVVARLELGATTHVLDVGCGAGGFLALARARGARVRGLDGTPELVAIARRRLEQDIEHGDLETLPYADATFDVVTGFNSFQYAANPDAALAEARRVVRSGGHVVAATWGRPEDCEAAGHLAALRPLLPPPPPNAGGPFALSDEQVLRDLVARAGLTAIDVVDVACPWLYRDDAHALRALMSAGPAVLAIRTSGEDRVRDAIAGAIAPYRTADGGYRIENKFRYVLARR